MLYISLKSNHLGLSIYYDFFKSVPIKTELEAEGFVLPKKGNKREKR